MSVLRIFILLLSAAIAGNAQSDEKGEVPYSYLEVAYQNSELAKESFQGFGLSASAALHEFVYLIGGYTSATSDEQKIFGASSGNVDFDEYSAGAGFRVPIDAGFDFFSDASYLRSELDVDSVSEARDGYVINSGIKARNAAKNGIELALNYSEIEEETDVGFSVFVSGCVMGNVDLRLGYSNASDVDVLSAGLRLIF